MPKLMPSTKTSPEDVEDLIDINDEEDLDGDEDLDEDTAASSTLKPGAGSGGTMSKAEMLDTFVQLMSQLGKEDLTNFFNDSIAQIGHEADQIPNNASASNQDSIKMKTVAKEDIDDMFAGDDLTEEFKDRAVTVFEAALNTRINLELAQLEEEFEEAAAALEESYNQRLEEEVENMYESLTEKLDSYLDYAITQWMEENAVAIESTLRAEIAEDFISSLHNLFSEHYIKVPETELDIVADLQSELEEAKEKLNDVLNEKLELEAIVNEATMEATLDEVSEGLAATQVEKLRTLAEGVEFTDIETYRKKLNIIKENYFKNSKSKPASSGLITEEIAAEEDSTSEAPVPADMAKYVNAISKIAR